ncbi:tail fiber protein [Bradyrhizobium sp. BRP22]|uniref:tail fiber protein n=1 Tax=Bradyrhizobium sp. BRP22 TaxID=2793821 RepID=UPI001CD78CB6|nr:tail fiber protein [Bradyrhizobium sp. BRP22]MCA1458099.1 tail fiber protein [Bradyrhizobium sp. BRP22]
MPADTTSLLLGLLMQGTGNNNNSWGDNLNQFVFAYLEQAIAGYITKTILGGPYSLNAAEHRAGMIEFTGTLTSNATVTIDNTSKRWRIFNNTTGNFVLLLKTASGNPVEIPQGTHKDILCDGADHIYREDADEVGNLIHHAGTTAPPGTIACSGGTYVRADHPDLFNKIGTTWGAGNGSTTAGLPNFTDTNRFLRAAGGSLAVGAYQSHALASHTHPGATFSGTTSAVSNDHTHNFSGVTGVENQSHTHGYTVTSLPFSGQLASGGGGFAAIGPGTTGTENQQHNHNFSGTTSGISANHTHTFSGTTGTIPASGGTETRPENAAVLICIKV